MTSRRRFRTALAALLRLLRPPVRLRFSRGGSLFSAGTLAIGLAAINTGDNLLYLLVGAMMGFIAVSGWMSNRVIWGVDVKLLPPRAATAGAPVRMAYELVSTTRRMPSYAVEVVEPDGGVGFAPVVRPGHAALVRTERVFPRRGVVSVRRVTVATSFPFGLFVKERDVKIHGEVIVWPRRDRKVREPATGGDQARRRGLVATGAAGSRGEFRGLREFRPGDDPRDVHWRSTARLGEPLIREYERDNARSLWLCLHLATTEAERADAAAEMVAALAERGTARNERVALVTSDHTVMPGQGRPQLERILDALAFARFRPDAPAPVPPVPTAACVLVTPGRRLPGYADVLAPEERTA